MKPFDSSPQIAGRLVRRYVDVDPIGGYGQRKKRMTESTIHSCSVVSNLQSVNARSANKVPPS
jgi:hypothetical protein